MEIKIELNRNEQCDACLTQGRKLAPLGQYAVVFGKLLDHSTFYYYNNVNSIQICWECQALLRNVTAFQTKVQRAAQTLKQVSVLDRTYSLSTLTTHLIEDYQSINYTYEEPELKKIVHIEVKSEDNEDVDFFVDTDFVQEEEEEEQRPKKERDKPKKEKRGKKPQNRKYKVIRVTKDYTMRREPITDVDFYMRKERESLFFKKKSFKCHKCVISFLNRKFLNAHMKENHEEKPNSQMCNICESQFTDSDTLARHQQQHYQKCVCNHCNYECMTKQHMRWHLSTIHHKVYQCTLCDMTFEEKAKINDHHKQWHSRFDCDTCGTTFKTRSGIERHIQHQHAEFHCQLCDKRFARKRYLTVHNRTRHSDVKIENAYCVECDKHFSTVASYKSHLYETAKHRNIKKSFPCPGCEKSFSKKTYLNEHYAHAHLKLARHRCHHCHKTFTRGEHLTRHVRRVHEGVPPVKDKVCYVCGRAFSLNRILIHHLRTHTGERPHACSRCPASFSQRAALVTHTRSVHRERLTAPSTQL